MAELAHVVWIPLLLPHWTTVNIFCQTDVQLFCRGNNGCWRWGGPSARYNPPLPWALRQVWEHRAKFFVHPNLNILREKNRLTRSEFWRPFFSNPGLSTQWSRVQCSGSGRTSSKLLGVESNLCGITASSRELHPSRIVMFLTWPAGKKHHSNPNHKHHVLPWPDQVWSQPAIPTRLDGWSWDAGPLEVGFCFNYHAKPVLTPKLKF